MKKKPIKEILDNKWPVIKDHIVADPAGVAGQNSDYTKLHALMQAHSDKLSDADSIKELLPDVAQVEDILISSVLSPRDLVESHLTIKLSASSPVIMAEIIKRHLNDTLQFDDNVRTMLTEALFTKGSYPTITIPAVSIQGFMDKNNIAVESIDDTLSTSGNIGLLSRLSGSIIANESFVGTNTETKTVVLSDNPMHLLKRHLLDHQRSQKTMGVLSTLGLEGTEEVSIYSRIKTKEVPEDTMVKIDNPDSNPLNPIQLHPPQGSVIPLTSPGEPERHLGYYVLMDPKTGTFLDMTNEDDKMSELADRLKNATSVDPDDESFFTGIDVNIKANKEASLEVLASAYRKKFEAELVSAVKDGVVGTLVDVTAGDDFYRVMLARQLARQKTRLVFVPKEMMSYIAFSYNKLGIGISLLEKTMLYASLRAILMFAKITGDVQNSIPTKDLEVTLDSKDPNKVDTLMTVLTEYASMQTSNLPVGQLKVGSILDALQKAGIRVKVNGGDTFPGTSLNVTDTNKDVHTPDNTLTEDLRRAHHAGLLVSPDSMEIQSDADFATSVAERSLLQGKRVIGIQNQFTPQLAKLIKQYIFAGGPLYQELKKIHGEIKNPGESLEEMIQSIEVVLPKPTTAKIKAQLEAFEEYSRFVKIAVELYISEDNISDMVDGEVTDNSVDAVRSAFTSYLLRNFLKDQGMLPELDSVFNDPDLKLGDVLSDHNDAVVAILGEVMRSLRKVEDKEDKNYNKVVDKLQEEPPVPVNTDGENTGDPEKAVVTDTGDTGNPMKTEVTDGGGKDNIESTGGPKEGEVDSGANL